MSRKYLLFFVPLLLGACVVAFVNAQESSRRSVLITPNSSNQASGVPTPAEEPLGLSDRLKSIRRSVTSAEDSSSTAASAPILGPVQNNPALSQPNPAPRVAEGQGEQEGRTAIPGFSSTPAPARNPNTPSVPSVTTPTPAPAVQIPSTSSARRQSTDLTGRPKLGRDMANKSDSEALLVSTGPRIRVEAAGPKNMVINKAGTYTISVVNDGDSTANNLVVRVAFPPTVDVQPGQASLGTVGNSVSTAKVGDRLVGGKVLEWKIDILTAQAREELKLEATPKETQPVQLAVDWAFTPVEAQARLEVKEPKLNMRLSGPSDVLYGETKVYTITLSNPGDGDAENVTIQLSVGAGKPQSMNIGSLGAGQVKEIEVQLEANKAGQMPVEALATADSGLKAETTQSVLVRRANLHVEVIGPARQFAGAVGSYKVIVRNTGNATAENVVAGAALPQGAKALANNPVSWRIGTLTPGAEKDFVVRCELLTAGTNVFEARTQAAGDLAAATRLSTEVQAVADLKLLVKDPDGPQAVGTDVVYEVEISNRGTKSAENVQLLAQFSEGIEPISVDGIAGEIVPGQVIFQPINQLNAEQKIVVRITARADVDGNHIFRAMVKCGDPETRLISEESTRFFADDFGTPAQTVGSQPVPAIR